MRINILFGGAAGLGPNILTNILGKALLEQGYYVFYSRDYESLIRGGHNFNVLTFSDSQVDSNDSKLDIIIALDENTEKKHKKDLKKTGIIIKSDKGNMYFAGRLFKSLCMDFKLLEEQLKKLSRGFEENMKDAKEGYDEEKRTVCKVIKKHKDLYFMNGNQGIVDGALKSGLDVYFAYPMTPATAVLMELAGKQKENNIFVSELENEIAVVMAGIGASATGAKAMVGTSGGGFDLMTEGLSMASIAEIPIIVYLSSRPGPGTGVATYTGQGELQLARHCGHGEWNRVVLAPGDAKEASELTSQCFYLSQKYKIPVILLGDKHLAESFFTFHNKPTLTKSGKLTKLIRFNSYEKTKTGEATENAEIIKKNVEARIKKWKNLSKEASKFEQYKVYGNKNSKNIILGYGSTKGAILDSIKEINCKFIQILYIEPFSEKLKKEIEGKGNNLILVENDAFGSLAEVIAEKTGVFISDKNKILRYDGRPFLADELNAEIKKRMKK